MPFGLLIIYIISIDRTFATMKKASRFIYDIWYLVRNKAIFVIFSIN